MRFFVLLLVLGAVCGLSKPGLHRQGQVPRNGGKQVISPDQTQRWNYVNVKPNGYMFWWLYLTSAPGAYTDQPLIVWLQGGPGSSSTGYGNFAELGPLDIYLQPRPWSWVESVNVIFIDNPVGTGYSYVTDNSAYCTDNDCISRDLVTCLTSFYNENPEFKTVPFYIFSESYGGKMAIGFADALNQAIAASTIELNFAGVNMGDGWVSPIDSVITWAPYLYGTGMVDEAGYNDIDASAQRCKAAVDAGDWELATTEWGNTENVVETRTYGVNFYNILLKPSETTRMAHSKTFKNPVIAQMYRRHVQNKDQLDDIMNGPIKVQLAIIPENVTWGGQSGDVFDFLTGDFMKPATLTVEKVLNTSSIHAAVFNGQLDLIVDIAGTTTWVKNLKWAGGNSFLNTARRLPIPITDDPVEGYVKTQDNFSMYWILNSGHMIPEDNPEIGYKMLEMITKNNNSPV